MHSDEQPQQLRSFGIRSDADINRAFEFISKHVGPDVTLEDAIDAVSFEFDVSLRHALIMVSTHPKWNVERYRQEARKWKRIAFALWLLLVGVPVMTWAFGAVFDTVLGWTK